MRVPRIKVYLDRFTQGIKFSIRHLEYTRSKLRAFVKLYARLVGKTIEKGVISTGLRFPFGFHHVEHTKASVNARVMMEAKLRHIERDISQIKASQKLFAKLKHTEVDNSRLSAMVVRPVTLGTLMDMPWDEFITKTLQEITFEEVDM